MPLSTVSSPAWSLVRTRVHSALAAALPFALALVVSCLLAGCAAGRRPIADRVTDPQLRADVQQLVAELGSGVRAAVWFGPADGEPQLAWNVETPLPCASAIKAAYLVELFAAHANALGKPLPGADAVLADGKHPAVAHFSAEQRATAQKALGGASVHRIAEAMISGKGVDNLTYNLAANLVTASFGGPAWLEAKLHARAPEWRGLQVRRYMLADRAANGDNEATAHALADVHARLARSDLPGVPQIAIDAARSVLARAADAQGRTNYGKGGALDSDPVTRVEAGWRTGPEGAFVHVVMLAHDGVPAAARADAGQRLGAAAAAITARLQRPATLRAR